MGLTLVRREDWPERLAASIARQAKRRFKFGSHDCTTAWADNCKAMTGTDPMAEFRGQYHDAATAKEALERIGSNSLYHTMTAKFGRPVPPAMARRGDPVLVVIEARTVDSVFHPGGPALMTCLGELCVGPTMFGPERRPTATGRYAWRVG